MTSTQGPQGSAASGLDQFLQPQSMVTPSVLGTVAMFGTNTIGAQTTRRVAELGSPSMIGSFSLITPAFAQSKEGSRGREFFQPWTLAPRDPLPAPKPADTPTKSSDVAQNHIIAPASGDCTTVDLPAGDAAAATRLAASTGSPVSPGPCPPR